MTFLFFWIGGIAADEKWSADAPSVASVLEPSHKVVQYVLSIVPLSKYLLKYLMLRLASTWVDAN